MNREIRKENNTSSEPRIGDRAISKKEKNKK